MCKQARILLVEDDPDAADLVREALREAKYAIEHVSTYADAAARIGNSMYGAVILDLGLPDGNGAQLAEVLRSRGDDVPILMLTAQADVSDRLDGFARGADDYLCKPYVPEELLARVRALLRRSHPESRHILRYGSLELDLVKRGATYRGTSATLSDREASVLAYFMRHAEEHVSREQLAQSVFGLDPTADSGVVNVYVNYLRNKLEHGERTDRLIHTIRGVGYMLSETEPE